jgi:hypothetical protein
MDDDNNIIVFDDDNDFYCDEPGKTPPLKRELANDVSGVRHSLSFTMLPSMKTGCVMVNNNSQQSSSIVSLGLNIHHHLNIPLPFATKGENTNTSNQVESEQDQKQKILGKWGENDRFTPDYFNDDSQPIFDPIECKWIIPKKHKAKKEKDIIREGVATKTKRKGVDDYLTFDNDDMFCDEDGTNEDDDTSSGEVSDGDEEEDVIFDDDTEEIQERYTGTTDFQVDNPSLALFRRSFVLYLTTASKFGVETNLV